MSDNTTTFVPETAEDTELFAQWLPGFYLVIETTRKTHLGMVLEHWLLEHSTFKELVTNGLAPLNRSFEARVMRSSGIIQRSTMKPEYRVVVVDDNRSAEHGFGNILVGLARQACRKGMFLDAMDAIKLIADQELETLPNDGLSSEARLSAASGWTD